MAEWKDRKNLISKVTTSRFLNGIRVLWSFYMSRMNKNVNHPAAPLSLSIEPTTSCNLKCPECPSGLRQFTRRTGHMDLGLFKKIIDEVSKKTLYLTLYFQGEPFIHPGIFEMLKIASDANMYTATSTNAHFLDDENAKKTVESGLDRLIVSIDGTTQEVYEQYRISGELEKVKEGTRNVLKWKKKLNSPTPHVIFQFLVVRPNEHQIPEVHKLAEEMGVDEVRLKTAQIYDYKNGNNLIPTNEKYSRYIRSEDGKYRIKNSLDNHCWRMWSSTVITQDGMVVPCCFDKDATHEMGDLKEESFNEVWNKSTYQNFRKSLLKSRSEIDICKNCSEGTKVWT